MADDDLLQTYGAYEAKLDAADNVGRTGDHRDLYALFDAMVSEMRARLPPFACREGCYSCCFAPPLVTGLEYEAIHRHLLALPREGLDRIIDNAEMVRPLIPAMVRWHQAFSRAERSPMVTIQCPFLVDGRCSAYPVRPLICRGYGQSTTRSHEADSRFFGSQLALAHIEHSFPGRTARLPSIQPYMERLRAMSRSANATRTWLPLWLWAHLDGRELKPEVNMAPDFDALLADAPDAEVASHPSSIDPIR